MHLYGIIQLDVWLIQLHKEALYAKKAIVLKIIIIRPDLKIYWFVVTRVCCFQYTQPVGNFFFFHFEMERIALILIYLTWISSSSLCSIYVYFFCNVDATIMILAYLNPQNPRLASKRLHGTSFPRLSLLCPSPWMGWCCNYWLEG